MRRPRVFCRFIYLFFFVCLFFGPRRPFVGRQNTIYVHADPNPSSRVSGSNERTRSACARRDWYPKLRIKYKQTPTRKCKNIFFNWSGEYLQSARLHSNGDGRLHAIVYNGSKIQYSQNITLYSGNRLWAFFWKLFTRVFEIRALLYSGAYIENSIRENNSSGSSFHFP